VAVRHVINLGAAWRVEERGADSLRLGRSFGSPRLDPSCERMRVVLDALVGARRVRLNEGDWIELPTGRIVLDGPFQDRNRLELEFDPETWGGPDAWGRAVVEVVDA
jgi:hypothetical protein